MEMWTNIENKRNERAERSWGGAYTRGRAALSVSPENPHHLWTGGVAEDSKTKNYTDEKVTNKAYPNGSGNLSGFVDEIFGIVTFGI